MDKNDLNALIESFRGYRDLLAPIQKNLMDFTATYDNMSENVDKLNTSFGGDVKKKLDELFNRMSAQVAKATDLASQINRFTESADKYASGVNSFAVLFGKMEERLNKVMSLESRVEEQIARLDEIIEQKARTYNLKELQHALDRYGEDVKTVTQFINKDVTEILMQSRENLISIKGGIDGIVKSRTAEDTTLENLLDSNRATEAFLKKITENRDVNEAYLFETLDKWAESRSVKMKK